MAPSRIIGTLFVISGILGIVLLALDQVLRTGAPQHYDALILFVIIDFLIGALAFPMPEKLMLKVAAIWSALRIVIQLGDVTLGPMFQFTTAQFADYLFNPASALPASLGNPTGIPPVPIDLILICDIAVLLTVARASMKK
jgi:hypothetical protein